MWRFERVHDLAELGISCGCGCKKQVHGMVGVGWWFFRGLHRYEMAFTSLTLPL